MITAGSGRPVDATVAGDANQDGNYGNDRLPGSQPQFICGARLCKHQYENRADGSIRKNGWKLEFTAESFNLFNRLNSRFQLTSDGAMSNAAQFNYGTKIIGINYFPAYYQVPTNFMHATNAYAPRQIQFALRLGF